MSLSYDGHTEYFIFIIIFVAIQFFSTYNSINPILWACRPKAIMGKEGR